MNDAILNYLEKVKARGLVLSDQFVATCMADAAAPVVSGSAGHLSALAVDRLKRSLFRHLKHQYSTEYLDKTLAR